MSRNDLQVVKYEKRPFVVEVGVVVGEVEGEVDFLVEVEVDVAMCLSPKCHRPRLTHTKKIKSNPFPKMIILCFRKRSENEGLVSLGFIIESYQASFRILTENKKQHVSIYVLLIKLMIRFY